MCVWVLMKTLDSVLQMKEIGYLFMSGMRFERIWWEMIQILWVCRRISREGER
ncbi:hypothetical protein Hanom_Chr11g01020061 [Helianthus anomalus]